MFQCWICITFLHSRDRENPLNRAAHLGKNKIHEYLLDNSAWLNSRNLGGQPAPDIAQRNENPEAIERLVSL